MSNTSPTETIPHKLRRWFIAPSAGIKELDQQRLAALLSSLLLGIMALAILVESITVLLIEQENYTGYRQTFASVCVLAIIYFLSRTRHVRLTGVLTVISVSLAGFITALAEPSGVLGGLLDYLIISIWLGSLFLKPGELALLMLADLIGLLVFPLFAPIITLNDILIGPFSFILVTSILIILITRHRNLLEQDRGAELAEKEKRSRREASRTRALLRVADRLNAQLDQATLLTALCEEAARALNVPVAIVTLYDKKRDALYAKTATGLPTDLVGNILPIARSAYEQNSEKYGKVFSIRDLRANPALLQLQDFGKLDFRSLAIATMEYERELIGSLITITLEGTRDFTEDELLLLRGLADQAALAIINTRLYKDARRRLENLQALRTIDTAIATNHDLQKTLDVLLDNILGQLKVDAAIVLILDETKQVLEYAASKGFYTPTFRYTRLRLGEGIAGRSAQQNKIISIPDLRVDPQTLIFASSLDKESFISYFAVPLATQGQVKGVLEILHRSPLDPDDEWLGFLETLGGQAAIAIESSTLFEDLQKTNNELSRAYDSTIEGWSHALDLRDKETEGHTQRVTELTLELARFFGFNDQDLIHVRRGSLLHDIGKMGVPDKILFKEGTLDPEEWKTMKQHPVNAHEMLLSIDYLRPALDIPYCHHEKWDGSGYPRGLKGEEIPLAARIFAVVDVWDALTSDRPYRYAWTPEKALEYIEEQTGGHFDPRVAEEFIKLIRKKMMEKKLVNWRG